MEETTTTTTTTTSKTQPTGVARVMDEMRRRASSGDTQLAEGLAKEGKTEDKCWSYITRRARELAVNGCACIEDEEVYGWAVHYFTEESEEVDGRPGEAKPAKAGTAKAPAEKPAPAEGRRSPGHASSRRARRAEDEEPTLFGGMF